MAIPWNDRRRERQRIKPKWKEHWPKFMKRLEKRLRQGHREYGDRSFGRPLFLLLSEVEEELLDVSNWAFFGWTRIHELREKVRVLEDKLDEEEMERLLGEMAEVVGGEDD